jgi:hypothetical protein
MLLLTNATIHKKAVFHNQVKNGFFYKVSTPLNHRESPVAEVSATLNHQQRRSEN